MPLSESQELIFRKWYGEVAKARRLSADPDDPRHYYDYRSAWSAGVREPGEDGHWPSKFKADDHPNRFVIGEDGGLVDTKYGRTIPLEGGWGGRVGGGGGLVPELWGVERGGSRQEVQGVSWPPVEEGRNLLNPYLPGTRAFTERVDKWEPPNPLTTPVSENYMYDVGAVAPIAYHGSEELLTKIGGGKNFQGFHAGTKKAALERLDYHLAGRPMWARNAYMTKVDISPKRMYMPGGKMLNEIEDATPLFILQHSPEETAKLLKEGYDVIPYVNAVENKGSVSYMVLDPAAVKILKSEYIEKVPRRK